MLFMRLLMKFADSWETKTYEYFENETQFLTLIKEFINCTLGAILWQKIDFHGRNL